MKRVMILLLVCAVLLTGCGFAGANYRAYITAVLDATYHSEYDAYIELTEIHTPDAPSMFAYEQSALSERIQTYFGIKSDLLSEDMQKECRKLAGEVLKKTKYSVRDVVKSEDGYEVTLMISPMDFWEQSAPDVKEYYENDFTPRYAKAPTKESADRMENVYAFQVFKILNAHVETMDYENAVPYQFTIKSGQDGVSAETWKEIDTLLLNLPSA